jgi:hypothetical protein
MLVAVVVVLRLITSHLAKSLRMAVRVAAAQAAQTHLVQRFCWLNQGLLMLAAAAAVAAATLAFLLRQVQVVVESF